MPFPLLVLALSAFAIGTTEFVIMGLLPEVAVDLGVSIPGAGWLVTGYALGVAIGAPFMAAATANLPRRKALIGLMGIFILGNLLCAVAASYGLLMFARVVTALCHGAFFGIGAVVAASLVAPERRASAVALMFTGLTLANVLGVPLGTALGQWAGWRSTFWAVTVIGVLALIGLVRVLPKEANHKPVNMRAEIAGLRGGGLWLALSTTVLFSAAVFATFTYVAPILRDLTGVTPRGVTGTLLLIGLGLTLGNFLGGKFADRSLPATLAGGFLATALASLVFSWTAYSLVPAELTLLLWGIAGFSLVPALQVNVMRFGHAAPNLVSTLNIAAFNVGNALGAWLGGVVLERGFGLDAIPLVGAALALLGVGAAVLTSRSRSTVVLAPAID